MATWESPFIHCSLKALPSFCNSICLYIDQLNLDLVTCSFSLLVQSDMLHRNGSLVEACCEWNWSCLAFLFYFFGDKRPIGEHQNTWGSWPPNKFSVGYRGDFTNGIRTTNLFLEIWVSPPSFGSLRSSRTTVWRFLAFLSVSVVQSKVEYPDVSWGLFLCLRRCFWWCHRGCFLTCCTVQNVLESLAPCTV